MRRVTRAVLPATLVAAALLSAGSASAATAICIPSWSGYGPTVTVKPDLTNPTRSQVYYNSSAFSIVFDLCVI